MRRDRVSLVAGGVTMVAALGPPLHAASERVFTAHMIQHELLMAVAAPLLAAGQPGVALLSALPGGARRFVARAIRAGVVRATWRAVSHPVGAWLAQALAIWIWHAPFAFQAALANDALHALEHACFLGSAFLYWWSVLHPRRRAALGASVLSLFTTAAHTAALGALLAMSRAPWYPAYAAGAPSWGLTPLEDQQLAGLVMWIPAGVVYLFAALVVVRQWLHAAERSVERAERAHAPARDEARLVAGTCLAPIEEFAPRGAATITKPGG